MRQLTDKQVCVFTIALHLMLVIAAKILIDGYQDGFLVLSGISLVVYFVFLLWVYRGRVIYRGVLMAYVLGVVIQAALTQCFGWIGDPYYGYLGKLGFGSGMAMLLYGVALVASCVVLLMLHVVKWMMKK